MSQCRGDPLVVETFPQEWDHDANSRQSVSELMKWDIRCGWILEPEWVTLCSVLNSSRNRTLLKGSNMMIEIHFKWLTEMLTTQAGSLLTISLCACNFLNLFSIILSISYAFVSQNKVLSVRAKHNIWEIIQSQWEKKSVVPKILCQIKVFFICIQTPVWEDIFYWRIVWINIVLRHSYT